MAAIDKQGARRAIRVALGALLGVIVALGVGLAVWALLIPAPQPEALVALQSTATVTVSSAPWLTFAPADKAPRAGLVFYPGGRVDQRAYAPAMAALAEQGYLVVIPQMPLNLAVLAPNRADRALAAHPEVARWAVGGHSLGGAMAAQYAFDAPASVAGLVLWGAYPPASVDLHATALQAAVVYAEYDGLSTPFEVEEAWQRLPSPVTWTLIAGGNHAGFGWYGPQRGDGLATISRVEQQAQAVAATAALLAAIE